MAYNILFISHERKLGGANHSLIELVQGLRKLGNNVSVVVLYRGCPIDKKLRELGIETFPCFFGWWQQPKEWAFPMKILFRALHWAQRFSVMRLARYVKKKKIDIIHSNSSVIDIGAQTAAKTGCKHVWHFREFGEADYRLEYMHGRQQSMDYAYKNSDMIIFISTALFESYKPYADSAKTRIVYDGIISAGASGEAPPQPLHDAGEKENVYTFLVTGNISPGKNQKLVVEAAHILVERMGIRKCRFQIYFAGALTSLAESKRYMKELRRLIGYYGMDNLFFTGYVDDMARLRSQVDSEIIPSMSEAYGRVTLEAMQFHNLVIAADSGANPELIGQNEHGLLFQGNNADDLAAKMLQAMTDDLTECIENAYEYVGRVHRQEESCHKVQEIYDYIYQQAGT